MKNLSQFQLIVLSSATVLALALILHTFIAPDGWQQRRKVRDDLTQLQNQNKLLEEQIEALQKEVRALRTNPKYQERTIRKELGYVKKDDIVLELSPKATPPTKAKQQGD